MTIETYNNIEEGDKVPFTQKCKNWHAENLYDNCNVGGELDFDSAKKYLHLAAGVYQYAEVMYKIRDVGMGDPGFKVKIVYDNFEDISVFSYKYAYIKRGEND